MRLPITIVAFAAAIGAGAAFAQQSTGEVEHGRKIFKICAPCHDVGRDAKHKTGPALIGLFGRPAGQVEGYASSLPMTLAGARGLVWADETLDRFITDPQVEVPDCDMHFIGVKDAVDRADLLAFLHAVEERLE